MYLLGQFLTKYVRKFLFFFLFSFLFSWKWNFKRTNFILHFQLTFTYRMISCRLFSPTEFEISYVQVYLINFQTRFSRKLSREWKKFILYLFLFFHKRFRRIHFYKLFGWVMYIYVFKWFSTMDMYSALTNWVRVIRM